MKTLIVRGVRFLHEIFLNKGLPNKVAIYFHAVEKADLRGLEVAILKLLDCGYVPCTLEEYLNTDNKCFFVSFDDNYKSWIGVLDLLHKYNIKAAFYVNTLPVSGMSIFSEREEYYSRICHYGERKALSQEQIFDIHNLGHTIGAHTHSHFDLNAIPFEMAVSDIENNVKCLEEIVGDEIRHFSYPFGMRRNFNNKLREWFFEKGFKSVANAIPGLQHMAVDPYDLNRTRWNLHKSIDENIVDLCIDGSLYERLSGRSAVG